MQAPALADPRVFPVDLDVRARRFSFLTIDESVLERSAFLDTRIEAPLAEARAWPAADLAGVPVPARPPAFLWHTSFCCSTLLARALHLPPAVVALKEPLVLRRLSDARDGGLELGDLPELALRLLARPWAPGAAVLVKPTHAALNIAAPLLAAVPAARGVVLHSTLDDFLVSNLKKREESRRRVPRLAERALRASGLAARLPRAARSPPDFLEQVALQWTAQTALAQQVLAGVGAGRLRAVGERELLADLPGVALACAAWLDLPVAEGALRQRAAAIARHHAKDTTLAYDADAREREASRVRARHGPSIAAALQWAGRHLLPLLGDPHLRPPLP